MLHMSARSCCSEMCKVGPSSMKRCVKSMVRYLCRMASMIMAIGYSSSIFLQCSMSRLLAKGMCSAYLSACAKGELQGPDPLAGVRLCVCRSPGVSGFGFCFLYLVLLL